MIVVADTSPLNYLVLLGEVEILPKLFGHVVVPAAVRDELRSMHAPATVQAWIVSPPGWVQIHVVSSEDLEAVSEAIDRGEREAIAAARRLGADHVLIDERTGRQVAISLGLKVTGTLGLLGRADELGLISDLPGIIRRLIEETNFRAHPGTIERLLRRNAPRKREP